MTTDDQGTERPFDALEALSNIFTMINKTMSTHRTDEGMRFASHLRGYLITYDTATGAYRWADGPHEGQPVGTRHNLQAAAQHIAAALTTPEGDETT